MGEWKGLTRLKGSKQFCPWSHPHQAQVVAQRVQLHVVHVIVTWTSVKAQPVWKKEVSRHSLLLNTKQAVITVHCNDTSSHCYKSLIITTIYFFSGGISPRSLVSSSVGQTNVACQTLSTGDIVITRIFFTEEEKEREKSLTSSPKRCPPPQ